MAKDYEDYFVRQSSRRLGQRLSGVINSLQAVSNSTAFRRWRQCEADVSLDGLRLDLIYERADHHRMRLDCRSILAGIAQGIKAYNEPRQYDMQNVNYEYRLELHLKQEIFGMARIEVQIEERIDPLGTTFPHDHYKSPSLIDRVGAEVDALLMRL